jgi:integral membrane protein (TIGR01906 family)
VNDNTSIPSRRLDPQLDPQPGADDPAIDPANDSDEPAFEWMKTAPSSRSAEGRGSAARGNGTHTDAVPANAAKEDAATEDSGSEDQSQDAAAQPGGSEHQSQDAAAQPGSSEHQAQDVAAQPGSRADRKAAEAAAADHAAAEAPDTAPPAPGLASGAHFSEPLPTSALQIRPPREDVERRNAEREQAANAKPVLPRVMQVLLAVFYPVILLVLAVRAVTSPLFLWAEYHRPGFPGDGYGFNSDDRMTYGSYAVDYLSNWSGPRYLGELVNRSGEKLFKDGEVSHMADVKLVILSAFGAGALLALISIAAIIYLRRRSTGGVRRGLFAGSIVTLAIIIGLGVLAVLGWEQFFTEFHRIFFANGTWTFALEDTLIRLFPGQFWVDAGIVIAGLVLVSALVTLILTWPTRRRRGLPKAAKKSRKDDAADPEPGAETPSGEDRPVGL